MAVTASFNPTSGVLTVLGDPSPNSVTLSRDAGGNILVNGGAVSISGGTPTFANTALIDVQGLDGNDTLAFDQANGALPAARLYAGIGDDLVTGGAGGDVLLGDAGNDTLLGIGGVDLLAGGAGDDTLTGGDANDTVFGEAGNDRMIWNPGDDNDLFEGGDGIDTVEVNGGNGDEVFALSVNGGRVLFERINPAPFSIDIGTSENLVLNANGGADTFSASGNLAGLIQITVDGGAGLDNLSGSNGNDVLLGGIGNDNLAGGDGNDTVNGGADIDNLEGGAGNDTFVLGAEASGIDSVTDSIGVDTVTSSINRSLTFADYSEIENLILLGGTVGNGNALQNRITGNAGANTLNGISNVDILVGGDASDTYFIDATIDTVVEAAGSAAGAADHVIFTGLAGQTHVLAANVERLTLAGAAASNGTANVLANIIVGNSAANVLNGGIGNDVMRGEAGNDRLVGSFGIDTLTGGAGNDAFVFNAPLNIAHRDVILDFSNVPGNNDAIHLENAVMTRVGAAGPLAANAFFAGAAAHDADDRIVYSQANGALSYDSNGSLAGGVTLLAVIVNKPALTFADFVVI